MNQIQASPVAEITRPRRSLTNALVYAAAFTSSWTAAAFGGFNIVDYLLAASVVVLGISWIFGLRLVHLSAWVLMPTAAALIVLLADTLRADNTSGQTQDILRLFISTAAVAIIIASVARTSGKAALRRVLAWWAAGIAVNALAAGAVSLSLVSFTGLLVQPTGDRLSGLSSHPNSIAFSITLAVPALVYLLSTARGAHKLVWIAAIAACGWGLVLADSRSGLLVTIPALAVALVLMLVQSRIRILALPIIVLAGMVLYYVLPDAVADTRLSQGSAQSDAGRVIFNDEATETFYMHPFFGGGFDAQGGVAVPLMVVSAGGLVLLIGYYFFVLRPLPTLWAGRRDRMAQMGMLSVVVFLGFGLLNPVFAERATFWPALIAFMWVTVASDPRSSLDAATFRQAHRRGVVHARVSE